MAETIPQDYRDLFEEPVVVALVTVMPGGQPQATPVWAMYDGTHVIVNTSRGRQKDRNMQRDSKVTVLVIDPKNPYRFLEVRGTVDRISEEDGLDVINQLSKKYTGNADYYARNPQMRGQEQRVTYRILPQHVTVGG